MGGGGTYWGLQSSKNEKNKREKNKTSTCRMMTTRPLTLDGGLTDDGGVVLCHRGVVLERGDVLQARPSSNAVVMRGHSRVMWGWCGATQGLVPTTAGLHEVSVVVPCACGGEIKTGMYCGAYCSREALP